MTSRLILLSSVLLCLLMSPLAPSTSFDASAQVQQTCQNVTAEAENMYRTGRFDEAIAALRTCLERDAFSQEEKIPVYRLISLAHMGLDEVEEAKDAIAVLLELAPDYEPDPVLDPPAYTVLVIIVKQQMQPPAPEQPPVPSITETPPEAQEPPITIGVEHRRSWLSSNRTWLVLGGGVLIAGTVTALALRGPNNGGGPAPLPLPPPPGLP